MHWAVMDLEMADAAFDEIDRDAIWNVLLLNACSIGERFLCVVQSLCRQKSRYSEVREKHQVILRLRLC